MKVGTKRKVSAPLMLNIEIMERAHFVLDLLLFFFRHRQPPVGMMEELIEGLKRTLHPSHCVVLAVKG